MDLVSIARRLSRPFVFASPDTAAELPLAARGLIGDGFTAALVAADGAIDWLCMPRFDSPSVFARILDPKRGGSMAVRPASRPFESLQRYDPDTNVLETLFYGSDGGSVRVVDSMPWSDDPRASIHELHRRVDCPGSTLELEIVFDPRFDYGRDTPRIHVGEHGLMAEGRNGEHLALSVSRRLDWRLLPDGGARATVSLRTGAQLWCVLSWNGGTLDHVDSHRPWEHLRGTRRKWREWAGRLTYDGPFRHHVLRSALMLKLLIYAPTGAAVAAPTTSLPEWIGGPRNWDYRFTWARDAAMAIRAANLIGYGAEARDFYHFIRDAVDTNVGLELMYTVDGRPVPLEEELPHLAGSFGSAPVRIGNGARNQTQLDTTGAIVDSAHLFEMFGGTLTLDAWRKLIAIVERAEARWQDPDHGMWEPRHGMRHNVHSKLMNWLAMDRGAQLAGAFGRSDLAARWTGCARRIHGDICARGMDAKSRHFVSVYGEERPDAALLLLAIHGFLPDDDPRLDQTVRWVQRELGAGPYLYRYRDQDGVSGPEGAFILCGFWLAEALALAGRLDEALEVFTAHAEASNHLVLLSEQVAPEDGTLLGNFPQAFSHLGLINAALRLDLALRLRDEGSSRAPHLVSPLARKP
jgi:alpha,alpha-trehalase